MILANFKFTISIFLLLSLSACVKDSRNEDKPENFLLWEDQTKKYLPATAEWTNRVEVADINGDQRLDLLFANGGNYSEPGALEASRIFINQGADSLFLEVTREIFGDDNFFARVIKVRDLNNDEIPDIVVGTTFQTQTQLYIGLGKGAFKKVTSSQLPIIQLSVGDLEFGDVDDDGDLDIVLADWGAGNNMENNGGRTHLWLNDGKAFFKDVTDTQMPDILIQFSWDLEFVDVDNDYDLDMAISCKRCGNSRMYVNDGKGFFQNKQMLPAYTNNYEFEIMDVNNDGFLDMMTVNDGEIVNESWSRREHIFLNDQGKRFKDATPTHWPDSENIGEDDNNIVFLDYDSDGDPDFLLSSLTGEDRLLENDGTGKFTLHQPIMKGEPTPHTLSMVLGDINGDKKMDIIMGQGEGKEIIEERIFMGSKINVDSAPPVIANYMIQEISSNSFVVRARIHDNKSPDMPHDWQSVELRAGDKTIPLEWYGEYLWKVNLFDKTKSEQWQICATDIAGNKKCLVVK